MLLLDESHESLLPRYMGFLKGVVDACDLPLNVSREILQALPLRRRKRRARDAPQGRTERWLEALRREVAERPGAEGLSADYSTLWESRVNRNKLDAMEYSAKKRPPAELLRFPSQKNIYCIAADSLAAAANAPFIEQLIKDLEVLYLTEPIDEPVMNCVSECKGNWQVSHADGLALRVRAGRVRE
ncbi:hypothetical protein WJX81_008127 [Elliptochloris bilobata]|uniref:Uncharacterized protein n=1 Tax=Elliptochloris bilobata TaxID=381761 RepID=A0AAW1RYA6_9CHLO